MRYWDIGILGYWDIEILEYWDIKILRYWDFKIFLYWGEAWGRTDPVLLLHCKIVGIKLWPCLSALVTLGWRRRKNAQSRTRLQPLRFCEWRKPSQIVHGQRGWPNIAFTPEQVSKQALFSAPWEMIPVVHSYGNLHEMWAKQALACFPWEASEASPCVRATAGPPQELELRAWSAWNSSYQKFKISFPDTGKAHVRPRTPHMVGIAQEETPTQKKLLFSSSTLTSWPSGDICLYPYNQKNYGKFLVGSMQPI